MTLPSTVEQIEDTAWSLWNASRFDLAAAPVAAALTGGAASLAFAAAAAIDADSTLAVAEARTVEALIAGIAARHNSGVPIPAETAERIAAALSDALDHDGVPPGWTVLAAERGSRWAFTVYAPDGRRYDSAARYLTRRSAVEAGIARIARAA